MGWLAPFVSELNEFSPKGLLLFVDTLLAAQGRWKGPQLSLVWTGPEGINSQTRDTRAVVQELMSTARSEVLIAGYRFDNLAEVLEPLHANMKGAGVKVKVFLDVSDRHRKLEQGDRAKRAVAEFIEENWPFGAPFPEFYIDPRTADEVGFISLHAKCIVVDEQRALIGSANFTDRGQTRNIELGVLIDDVSFAREVSAHWRGVIRDNLLVRAD
jgi:phosphatidylserine/phosphatidylglycerophosphate/cardiolipin synthase-like enzyme